MTWLPWYEILLLGSLEDIDTYMLNVVSLINELVHHESGECSLVSCICANVVQSLRLGAETITYLTILSYIWGKLDRRGSMGYFC